MITRKPGRPSVTTYRSYIRFTSVAECLDRPSPDPGLCGQPGNETAWAGPAAFLLRRVSGRALLGECLKNFPMRQGGTRAGSRSPSTAATVSGEPARLRLRRQAPRSSVTGPSARTSTAPSMPQGWTNAPAIWSLVTTDSVSLPSWARYADRSVSARAMACLSPRPRTGIRVQSCGAAEVSRAERAFCPPRLVDLDQPWRQGTAFAAYA